MSMNHDSAPPGEQQAVITVQLNDDDARGSPYTRADARTFRALKTSAAEGMCSFLDGLAADSETTRGTQV